METEGGGCPPPLTRCTGHPAPPPASPPAALASSPRGWTARPRNTQQVRRENNVITCCVQLGPMNKSCVQLHEVVECHFFRIESQNSLFNVHVHCLCHSCNMLFCLINLKMTRDIVSEWLCPDMGWCVCSDLSQHILNSHDRHVGSILLATPHADCFTACRVRIYLGNGQRVRDMNYLL